jgi:hypothetical protein
MDCHRDFTETGDLGAIPRPVETNADAAESE